MWYDATSAAGSLEDPAVSKAAGKIGYAYAPVVKTKTAGWLWTWAWAMPKTTKKADAAAKFMLWASGKDYEKLVGTQLGWSKVPAGKRSSTYSIPEYTSAASAFAGPTKAAIEAADPKNPGVQPRPAQGIQFIGIPEFPDLGTQVSQDVSAAIAGQTTVDAALDKGQQAAQIVADKYKK
jgi:sorbitol/mannitol transport system substrate-binding protein